jgi:hypothetical protein
MSLTKRGLDADNQKREAALEILIKVGVLQRCPQHDHVIYEAGGADLIENAYRMGNANWAGDGLDRLFANRRELTDTLKALSEDSDYCADECGECGYMKSRD